MSLGVARGRLGDHRALALRASRGLGCDADAEDLVQEALVRTLACRTAVPSDDALLSAWLRRVVGNLASNLRRARRVRARRAEALSAEHASHIAPASGDPLLRARLVGALARLTGPQRRVVSLVYLEERTLDEAAVAMGCAGGTARSHLHRALSTLRTALAPLRDAPRPATEPLPGASHATDA